MSRHPETGMTPEFTGLVSVWMDIFDAIPPGVDKDEVLAEIQDKGTELVALHGGIQQEEIASAILNNALRIAQNLRIQAKSLRSEDFFNV